MARTFSDGILGFNQGGEMKASVKTERRKRKARNVFQTMSNWSKERSNDSIKTKSDSQQVKKMSYLKTVAQARVQSSKARKR